MIAIVAVDKNWGIGRDNDMLFRLPLDLKRFREITKGNTVIMGRKTLESLPNGPLKNRKNVVISTSLVRDDCVVVKSVEEAVAVTKGENAFVIGGETVYKQLLPYCDKLLVTMVDAEGGADRYFPNISQMNDWMAEYGETVIDNGFKTQYVTFYRK